MCDCGGFTHKKNHRYHHHQDNGVSVRYVDPTQSSGRSNRDFIVTAGDNNNKMGKKLSLLKSSPRQHQQLQQGQPQPQQQQQVLRKPSGDENKKTTKKQVAFQARPRDPEPYTLTVVSEKFVKGPSSSLSSTHEQERRVSETPRARKPTEDVIHSHKPVLGKKLSSTSAYDGESKAALTSVARRVQYNFTLPSTDTTFFTQLGAAGVNVAAVSSLRFSWIVLRKQLASACASGKISLKGFYDPAKPTAEEEHQKKSCPDGGCDDGATDTEYSLVVGPPGGDAPAQNILLEALLTARGICFTTSDVAQVLSVSAVPGAYAVFSNALVAGGVIPLQSYFGESPTANVSIMYTVERRDIIRALAILAAV